jgi:triacylglycerol lipase
MTYPIVLAHGVCRFDVLWNKMFSVDNCEGNKKDQFGYFRGVRTMLAAKGYAAFHSNVAWAARVDHRADHLKTEISRILHDTGAPKINIIAHSMGGLDARHMMFNDRNGGKIHHRIASLTTISTPHWGSSFADWGLNKLAFIPAILKHIGLDLSGLHDLMTDACRDYNLQPEVKEFETQCRTDILFQTYAGVKDFRGVCAPLKLSYKIIEKKEGENDGLVSVQSAKWDEAYFKGRIEQTDHLNELGWWDIENLAAGGGPDALIERIHRFYAQVAAELP